MVNWNKVGNIITEKYLGTCSIASMGRLRLSYNRIEDPESIHLVELKDGSYKAILSKSSYWVYLKERHGEPVRLTRLVKTEKNVWITSNKKYDCPEMTNLKGGWMNDIKVENAKPNMYWSNSNSPVIL